MTTQTKSNLGIVASHSKFQASSWASATPRNSATAIGNTASVVLTVTSTTAGDLGIVVFELGTSGLTITPPSGWLAIDATIAPLANGSTSLLYGYYHPNMASGTTSFTFGLSGTSRWAAVYACYGGGLSTTSPEGLASNNTDSSSATYSTLTTGTIHSTDLMIWAGGLGGNTAVSKPTGTGTWITAIGANTTSASIGYSAILASGTSQTESGATSAASTAKCSFVVGFT